MTSEPPSVGQLYPPSAFKHAAPRQPLQIRRAFRNLVTRAHPDKGGDAARFRLIQQAYEVLSDPNKVRPSRPASSWAPCRSTHSATPTVVRRPASLLRYSHIPLSSHHVQRSHYDQTGKIIKTAEEEFMDSFAGGAGVALVVWAEHLFFVMEIACRRQGS